MAEGREVGWWGGGGTTTRGTSLFVINRVPWEQHFMSYQKGLELVMLSFLLSEVTIGSSFGAVRVKAQEKSNTR